MQEQLDLVSLRETPWDAPRPGSPDLAAMALPSTRYWLLAFAVYATVIFSTSLHYFYGPERTIGGNWYFVDASAKDPAFRSAYPDLGGAYESGRPKSFPQADAWKLSSVWGDAGTYLLQVDGTDRSRAPYKYRFLPTSIVHALAAATALEPIWCFVAFNVTCTLLTAMLFTWHLVRHYALSRMLALIGGTLFLTMLPTTGTVALPMLDPSSFLFAVLIFIAVAERNVVLFAAAALCGVATKELLVFSSLLWIVSADMSLREPRKLATSVCVGALPVLGFVAIRMLMGANAMEVNYGFDLSRGELPRYGERLLSAGGLLRVAAAVGEAFSLLWIGLINVGKHPLLRRSVVVVPLCIVAAIFLSSRIARVLGVLFPIVIPAFLLFFERHMPGHARPMPARPARAA